MSTAARDISTTTIASAAVTAMERPADGPARANLPRVISLIAAALILKVIIGIVLTYSQYLPPDFSSQFLWGRQGYFWHGYHWAFYAHILAGPLTLICGLLLLSEQLRLRLPVWHRVLGRLQAGLILLLLVPSGLWMSFYAETGVVAGAGFGTLAVATGLSVYFGVRCAIRRSFAEHRVWMMRCYLLLCSAVVLRLSAGLATVTGFDADWLYPVNAWTSWLIPLGAFELVRRRANPPGLQKSPIVSPPSTVASASRSGASSSDERNRTLPSAMRT